MAMPVPDRFRGLRVLLIQPDPSLMQYHEFILTHTSYKVTSTPDATKGLSMIMNGKTFECVLVDADMTEMDIMEFLHRVLKLQPKLSVIMMASNDTYIRVAKKALENGAVMCLCKPCAHSDISGLWKYVCRKRTTFPEDISNEDLPQKNQVVNNINRADAMPSTNLDSTMVTNNMSSSHRVRQGVNVMYGSMFKPVTNEDTFCNYDGREHIDGTSGEEITSMENKADKGKQIMEHDSSGKPDKDDKYYKRRKVVDDRVTWTPKLHNKFDEAMNTPDAYPSAILHQMNVSGLERNHTMSHLQDFREREDTFKIPNMLAPWERSSNFPLESYASKRRSGSTLSDTNALVIQSSNLLRPLKLNSGGIAFMTIDNIKAKLQGALPLPVPLATATINNSCGIEETNSSFGDPYQPLKASTNSSFGDPYQPLHASTNSSFSYPYQPLKGQTCMNSGTSYMTIENIRAKLLGAQPLHVPPVTTTRNTRGGVKATDHSFGDPFQPPMGEKSMSTTLGLVEKSPSGGQRSNVQMTTYGYGNVMEQPVTGEDSSNHTFGQAVSSSGVGASTKSDHNLLIYADKFLNGFDNGKSEAVVGSGVIESGAPLDYLGIATNSWLAGDGGTTASLNHDNGNSMEQLVTGQTSSNQAFGKATASSGFGANLKLDYNLGIHANNFFNDFAHENSEAGGGSGVNDSLAPVDYFGIATEPWVAGGGGGGTGASLDHRPKDLASPESFSYDLGILSRPHNFEENIENLFQDPNSSGGISLPTSRGEENNGQVQPPMNSIFPLDGSEGRATDNDFSFLNDTEFDLEMTMNFLDEVDDDLIGGPW